MFALDKPMQSQASRADRVCSPQLYPGVEAACQVRKEGLEVYPEIMVAVTAHANEVKIMREMIERIATEVMN